MVADHASQRNDWDTLKSQSDLRFNVCTYASLDFGKPTTYYISVSVSSLSNSELG